MMQPCLTHLHAISLVPHRQAFRTGLMDALRQPGLLQVTQNTDCPHLSP